MLMRDAVALLKHQISICYYPPQSMAMARLSLLPMREQFGYRYVSTAGKEPSELYGDFGT
jgi:hypothetical protein